MVFFCLADAQVRFIGMLILTLRAFADKGGQQDAFAVKCHPI